MAGSTGGDIAGAFGISGMLETGNAAPSRPSEYTAMRRFVVVRPVPWISHPVKAYCLKACVRMTGWKTTPTRTYEISLPKRLDQLPKVVVVCSRCGLNTHEHGLCSLHPILEFVHLDCGPRWRKV